MNLIIYIELVDDLNKLHITRVQLILKRLIFSSLIDELRLTN